MLTPGGPESTGWSNVANFRALHHRDEPLLLPNAWDDASAAPGRHTVTRLADLGVRRISTGSLLFRAALHTVAGVARAIRAAPATGPPAPAVPRPLGPRPPRPGA